MARTMSVRWRPAVVALVFSASSATSPASLTSATHTPKDKDEFTNIGCSGLRSLVDRNFATALHNELGDASFHSLIITISGCWGGGTLDEVAKAFKNTSRPVFVCSGGTWNQYVYGLDKRENGKILDYMFWHRAYYSVHKSISTSGENRNPTEKDAFAAALKTDTWKRGLETSKKNFGKVSTPEYVELADGGNMKLGSGANGSGATTFKAILFSNERGGWNDIAEQYRLVRNCGFPKANVAVFYEEGTKPNGFEEPANQIDKSIEAATRSKMLAAIDNLNPDANTQVYAREAPGREPPVLRRREDV